MEMTLEMEKLIKSIMAEAEKDGEPVTYEEAIEMAEMELGAKANFKHYEKADQPKKKKVEKVRKVDEDKKHILMNIRTLLEGMLLNNQETDTKVTMKTETELNFSFNGNDYTIKLTKHRLPKK